MGEPLKIQQKIEDVIDYATPLIQKWPKLHRYTLGERILNQMYDIADKSEAANRKYYKKTTMQEIDVKLAQLLRMVRRAHRTTYQRTVTNRETGKQVQKATPILDTHHYEVWAGKITEIGRMLGGWMKSINAKSAQAADAFHSDTGDVP